MRRVVVVTLFLCLAGCCTAPREAMDAMAAVWDSPDVSIKRYAEAGVECDPLLKDDPALPPAERAERTDARKRRLRAIEEFGLTLKEAQSGAH